MDRVEEKDFARSVVGFDGNQDCMKEELVQEVPGQQIGRDEAGVKVDSTLY